MAGHSQFKNILYRKGAQDAKKAGAFAKLAREITVPAKSGFSLSSRRIWFQRMRCSIQTRSGIPQLCRWRHWQRA